MWHTLADDQIFWATVATASAALLIAVVLEGRTTREEMDRRVLEKSQRALKESRRREEKSASWERALEEHEAGQGPDPGPPALEPLQSPQELRDEERVAALMGPVAALLMALWALPVAFVGSLVAVSPASYPGDVLAGIGFVVTLLCVAAGVVGLVWTTTGRIKRG